MTSLTANQVPQPTRSEPLATPMKGKRHLIQLRNVAALAR